MPVAASPRLSPEPRPERWAAWLTVASLGAVIAVAWWYLGAGAAAMAEHTGWRALGPGMAWLGEADGLGQLGLDCVAGAARLAALVAMPTSGAWSAGDAGRVLVMWLGMLAAMMLPAASPSVFAFLDLSRRHLGGRALAARVWAFVIGYLLAWSVFGLAATALHWYLHDTARLTPGMVTAGPWLGGGLLLVAAIYQWTHLKQACLRACRSPLAFFLVHWREGAGGALRMGMIHGAVCVGCCWALMLLMFTGGVMNLMWIAALAAIMLAERILPTGAWVGRVCGVVLAGMGLALLLPAAN